MPEKTSVDQSQAGSGSSKPASASPFDPAFARVKSGVPGQHVWRVERMKLVAMPEAEWGHFYRGDSYLVYSAVAPTPGAKIEVHLFYWLGSQTSQDEAGVAAFKTVELDDLLGGAPVQHREVEGRESQRFRACFRDGITFLEGGVASGLTRVTDEHVARMYLVKGRRQPVIRQLPAVEWCYFNDGDAFVIDDRECVFVWTGAAANSQEKIQAARLASRLKDGHGGGTVVIVNSGAEAQLPDDERRRFDALLPPGGRVVAPAEPDTADERQDRRLAEEVRLYRCSDADGALQVSEVKHGPLLQQDLNSDDSFIVDNGEQGVWVWVGRRASRQERSEGMRNAQGFVQKKGYPSHTPVTRVIDGGEPAEFRSLFRQWRDRNSAVGLGRQHSRGSIARTVADRFDAASLHLDRARAAQTGMVDDGTGNRRVWRVEPHGELSEVPEKHHGRFYGGDSYLVQYQYRIGGRDNWIIYYWLGAHSSLEERGHAALKAVELDDALGGRPVQVRVVQGKEPPHFLAMFGGRMIIYAGGKASALDGAAGGDQALADTYLLQVRGTSPLSTRAIQVPCRASSLNSNDCFVLCEPSGVTVWSGGGSTAEEQQMARTIAAEITPAEPTMLVEGDESDESERFWSALGGRGPYQSSPRLASPQLAQPARLFQCSTASGSFRVEEVADFEQQDLCSDDVMLLDAWDAIWVWLGAGSTREERQKGEQAAIEYLRTDPAGRGTGTPVLRVRQGSEPPSFTGFFGAWSPQLWASQPSWDSVCQQVVADNLAAAVEKVTPRTERTLYPPARLQTNDPAALPDDVDPTHKEEHLSEADFATVFGMTWQQYQRLPQWKRMQKKKAVGMF